MAKVKTLVDFHDKTDIDPKTRFPRLVPAGTPLEVTAERHAELAARGILPRPGESPPETPASSVAK